VTAPQILLLGGTGLLGSDLRVSLSPLGLVVAPRRAELDAENVTAVRDVVRSLRPSCIVNAAAFSAVDPAEDAPDVARRLNAALPRVLAEEAARLAVPLVHYSTDYVFDGSSSTPYTESDSPNPLNVYGETKLEGEIAVGEAGGPHLILRTAWLHGNARRTFVSAIREAVRTNAPIRAVNDQWGSPTLSRRVADTTADILGSLRRGDRFPLDVSQSGTYHLVATGAATWYDIATAVLAIDDPESRHRAQLTGITSAERGARARRPRYSVLDNTTIQSVFGVTLPEWRQELAGALAGKTQ
jgi:dTDP-4-dehydrorhamnose reductase